VSEGSGKVGVIGLGIMGKPMARNLLTAGFRLVVHNRSRAAVDELVAESPAVTAASSPREVAEQAEVVLTILPDSPDVRAVMFGPEGLAESLRPGSLYVDMSTIAPATAQEIHAALANRGVGALDAPVSGGDKGAIAGTLSIMVGGAVADFDRAKPLFAAMGKTIVHVGGPGAGQVVKACNQIVVALNIAAVSEALVLGAKAGVEPARIVEVLAGGFAGSRVLDVRGPTMIRHVFEPGFRVNLHRKDLGIVLATAREQGVPLPLTAVVAQLVEMLMANGHGDLDHSALLTAIEDLANFRIGAAGAGAGSG
jgi:2-hydroxy-3-oxopropionate reductase